MSKNKYQIPVIVKAVRSEFWQTLLAGAKHAAEEQSDKVNISLLGPPEETDVEEQVQILHAALANAPDAVVIASTSNELTVPAIEAAMAKGIPVVTIDNRINTDKIACFIATNNVAAAASAADAMVRAWETAGIQSAGKKVGVINSLRESKVDQDRDNGFMNRIQELVPDIRLLDVQYVENDQKLTTEIVKGLLEANNDLIGIFADNDQTGIGVAKAIRETGAQDRLFAYAFDSSSEEIAAIEEGYLRGMVVQNPFMMGYQGVKLAIDAIEGKEIVKEVDTGATIVTRENIKTPDVEKLLNPQI